jgi:hypothetical protein
LVEAIKRSKGRPRAECAEIARQIGISFSTFERKRTIYRRRGAVGLDRKRRADLGHSRAVPQEWVKLAFTAFFLKPAATYRGAHRELAARCAHRGIEAPSYTWVRRSIENIFSRAMSARRIRRIGEFVRQARQ